MKNKLLTISILTLLLAGQSAIAGESHENDKAIDAFINAQHDANPSNESVITSNTINSTNDRANDRAIDAFINSQYDARQDKESAAMQKVSFVTNEISESTSYKANKNPFSLDYSSDK